MKMQKNVNPASSKAVKKKRTVAPLPAGPVKRDSSNTGAGNSNSNSNNSSSSSSSNSSILLPPNPPILAALPEPPNQNETMLAANKVILKQLVSLTEQMNKLKNSKKYKDLGGVQIVKQQQGKVDAKDKVDSEKKSKSEKIVKDKKRDVNAKMPASSSSNGVKKLKKNREIEIDIEFTKVKDDDNLFIVESDDESSEDYASSNSSDRGNSTSDSDGSSSDDSSGSSSDDDDDSNSPSKVNKTKAKSNKDGSPVKTGIRFEDDATKESSTGIKYTTVPPLGRVPTEMLQFYEDRVQELEKLLALHSNTLDNMRSMPKKVIKDMRNHLKSQEETVAKTQKECVRLRGERAFVQVELEILKAKLEQLQSSYVKFESSLQTEFQYEISRHNNMNVLNELDIHDKTTGELMQKIDKLKVEIKFKNTKLKHQEDVIKNYKQELSDMEKTNADIEINCELKKKSIAKSEEVIRSCHEEHKVIEEEVKLLTGFILDLTDDLKKKNDSIKVYRAENDIYNAQVSLLEERDGICSTNLTSFRNNLIEAQGKCAKAQEACADIEKTYLAVKNDLVVAKDKFHHMKISANVEISLQVSEVRQGVASAAARLSLIHSTHRRTMTTRQANSVVTSGSAVARGAQSTIPNLPLQFLDKLNKRGQPSLVEKSPLNARSATASSAFVSLFEGSDNDESEGKSDSSRPQSGTSSKPISRPTTKPVSRPHSRSVLLKKPRSDSDNVKSGSNDDKSDESANDVSDSEAETETDAKGLQPSKPASLKGSGKVSPRARLASGDKTKTEEKSSDADVGANNVDSKDPSTVLVEKEEANKASETTTIVEESSTADAAVVKEKKARSKTPKTPGSRGRTPKTPVREEDIPDSLSVDDYLNAGKIALVLKSKVKTEKVLKDLAAEKKKVKKIISKWIAAFEQKHAREPTEAEKQKEISETFDKYNRYTFMITKITEKSQELNNKEATTGGNPE